MGRRSMVVLAVALLVGCASVEPRSMSATTNPTTTSATNPGTTTTSTGPTTSTSTSTSTTTSTSTSTTTSTSTSTSTTSTSTSTSTVPALPEEVAVAPIDPDRVPFDTEVEIGRSVEGQPITVVRRGDPGGVRVLVVGVIHGEEAAGTAVVDRLMVSEVPPDVELWLVRSMNPDGQAAVDRQNANLVDLNRNFPVDWMPLGEPGDWQYGGVGPASEPETRAIVSLGAGVRPDLVFWYHQDLFRLAPAEGRRGELRARYAELTGLPIVAITGGTYTGTAADWARTVLPPDGETITVELGPTLGADEADRHAAAVLALATEFW